MLNFDGLAGRHQKHQNSPSQNFPLHSSQLIIMLLYVDMYKIYYTYVLLFLKIEIETSDITVIPSEDHSKLCTYITRVVLVIMFSA